MTTKKDYNGLELLGIVALAMLIGIPLSFYYAWVIGKIITWFALPIHLTLLQLWSVIQIWSIIYEAPKKEEEDISGIFSKLFGKAFGITIVLGIIYLIHLCT